MLRPCQLVSLLGTVFLLLGEVGHDDDDDKQYEKNDDDENMKKSFRCEVLGMLCMPSTAEGRHTQTSLASRYNKKITLKSTHRCASLT